MMDYLKRPLLIEGEAGVGKTEVAKALAAVHGAELIRMQCYEGLDASSALYEWNYQRQLIAIKARENSGESAEAIEAQIFSEDYLLERPLLAAIRRASPPVLLIDEIDRADEEFEAFLLELLSDFQVTIPEFGTIKALTIPRVVLTSNATRELSDALRRRCLYHYLDFPDVDREAAILRTRLPDIDAGFALQIARMVAGLRKEELRKTPGVAETLDWAATLAGLGVSDLSAEPEVVHATLIALLKTHEDRARITPGSDGAAGGEGGVSARASERHELGEGMRRRLIGFVHTLRDAGFAIGRAETSDAARIIASPLADRPERLRGALKALFASNRGECQRFDELFDAFFRGRGVKRATRVETRNEGANASRRFEAGPGGFGASSLPERAAIDAPESLAAAGKGRERGASAHEALERKDFARLTNESERAEALELAEKLAKVLRARLTRRERARHDGLAYRPARNHPPFGGARRRADRPEIPAPQAEAAAARRAARRLGLDGALCFLLHPLSPRDRADFQRVRGVFCSTPGSPM